MPELLTFYISNTHSRHMSLKSVRETANPQVLNDVNEAVFCSVLF